MRYYRIIMSRFNSQILNNISIKMHLQKKIEQYI